MRAELGTWRTIEIAGTQPAVQALTSALESVKENAKYAHLIERNLKAVLSIEGALTNTFPVVRVYVIDAVAVTRTNQKGLAALLVQAAAYIEFYKDRSIFLPKFFQKRTDTQAKAEARRVAQEFQGA
jgi:hypothetical protein